MATNTEPFGLTPLTTEGLANLGHPLSLSDFNQDAQGRYWRTIRGEKTYYPREWFDKDGTFTGTGTQPGDKAGQGDSDFFHQGTKWDWTKGEWHNPINWANVIGLSAAGGVGAGIAAPAIGALAGGSGAAGGTTGGLTSALTSGLGSNATLASVLSNPLVLGGINTGIDAARGNLSWKDALNFIPAVPGLNNVGGLVTNNPIVRGGINAGVRSGLQSAATGHFDPTATLLNVAGGAVPGVAGSITTNPIARRGLTAGMNIGLNAAKTGRVDPIQAGVSAGRVLLPTTSGTSQTGSGMPTITRRLIGDGVESVPLGPLTPTGFTGFEQFSADDGGDEGGGGDDDFGQGGGVDDSGQGGDDGSGGDTGDGGDDGGDGFGPDPTIDVGPEPLPTNPSPVTGQPGQTLPGGGTGTHPSVGVPLPKPSTGNTGDDKKTSGGGALDDLTKLLSGPLGGLLGGFLSGLGQSLGQQKRQSFEGSAADPKAVMGDIGSGLKGLIGNYQTRNAQGVSLPDAYVDLTRSPVFTGGGMAMPVGIVPRDVSVGHPASLVPGGGGSTSTSAGIVPKAVDTGKPTEPPGVKLPGDTSGTQYALDDEIGQPMTDKQRALSALNLLGVS